MTATTDVRSFSDLGVDDAVVAALADAGITDPFPIQELSLPMALAGADLIGQARTGTGKTLAFGIPLVQKVDPAAGHTQALVVVPTRELCLQVHDDLLIAGAKREVRVVAAYGGRAIDPQSEAIAAGAPIVVGTPGRLLDLVRRRRLDLSRVTMLVLDEADEMLDMGFLPDVEQLIERCARQRQTLLFSATVPSEVVRLARSYMNKPTFMRSDVQQHTVAPQMRQLFFACHRLDKPAVVARILASPNRGRTLIFTRTKRMADVLAGELRERDIDAGVIHSDLRQEARERALVRFRKGTQDVLCATEVAARGLDIDQVTHVINYDCPDDERMYLHRIGRTGRAGATGIAVTLAVWNELARLEMIKRALQIDDETHEVFSTSPLLDDLFGAVPSSGGERRARSRPSDAGADTGDEATAGAPSRSRAGRRSRRTRRRKRRPDAAPGAGGGTDTTDRDTADGGAADPSQAATAPERTAPSEPTATVAAGADEQRGDDATTGGDGGVGPDGSETAADAPAAEVTPAAGEPHGRDDGAVAAAADETDPGGTDADADGRDHAAGRDAGDDHTTGAGEGRRRTGDRRARAGRERREPSANGDAGGRGARGRRGGGRRPARDAAVVEPVSPAGRSARGEGRPMLNRPLEISHLP
ncbi:MAG TPA: DEAD/DEAH box helicase [Euzebyales bacterium]|nr:DEAD/DEAH box helicase [Euzebyales bacterium]